MLTSKAVKKFAKAHGADLVGIGSMDRWEGAPKIRDPRFIFPEAKTCISLAFRIPRGYFRGIEEGTCFAPYTAMGYAGINEIYAPSVLREVCCFIEDHGFEAVPHPNIQLKQNVDMYGKMEEASRPVSPGLPPPDIMIDQRVAAFICGLGEFGWSKVFLTPEFGPLQRFVTLLTDAELEPDPIFEGKICDRCMGCARMCSGGAISMNESDTVTIAGHKIEFAKIDLAKCTLAYRGGNPHFNPFIPKDFKDYDSLGDYWQKICEVSNLQGYQRHCQAVEGARGCMRECYIHLEKRGRLTKKFASNFRKREPWCINLDEGTAPENNNLKVKTEGVKPEKDVLM